MLTFNLIGFCDCFVYFFSFDTQSKRAPLKVIKIAVTTICLLVWITPAITPSDNVNPRWSKILTHLKHKQQVNPCLTLVEYKITSRRWIRNYRYLKFSVNNFFYYFNVNERLSFSKPSCQFSINSWILPTMLVHVLQSLLGGLLFWSRVWSGSESATEKLYIDCCRALKAQLEP